MARNQDEAVRQARGEDLTITRRDDDEDEAQDQARARRCREALRSPPEGESAESDAAADDAGDAAEEKPAKGKKAKAKMGEDKAETE